MSTDLETIAMLRESAKRYVQDQYDFQRRWSVLNDPAGYSARAWQDYAELGWLALRLPEEAGGLDADAAAIGAVMEIVGSRLLMEPVLASAVVGTGLVLKQASARQKQAMLPRLADGSLKLAFACDEEVAAGTCQLHDDRLRGTKIGVLHGDVADELIVSASEAGGNLALCLVDGRSPRLQREVYRLVDGRGAANLRFDGALIERLGPSETGLSAEQTIAEVRDEVAAALCAETLGVVRSLVAATNEYLKVRCQFGKPIGANQALQHRMVELYLLQEEVRALTRAAQRALALPSDKRTHIVSGAKAYITGAARRVANEAVQMHGGVGISEELEVSHYFRRLMVTGGLFGGRDEHFSRFVEASLADA